MIVFLNFAPIEYMGGVEKWMWDIVKRTSILEEMYLVDVHPTVANVYAKVVLGTAFSNHSDKAVSSNKTVKRIRLTLWHFLPFTRKWKEVKNVLNKARIIYTKCDMCEILILHSYLGFSGYKKHVVGIHSPFLYPEPINFLEKLHNFIYRSWIFKQFLRNIRRVHSVSNRDTKLLQTEYFLKNVEELRYGIALTEQLKKQSKQRDKNKLTILFVGILSLRKGVDTLLRVIQSAPSEFRFLIAGSGPMEYQVAAVADGKNCIYFGQVLHKKLTSLYDQADVLLLPSRADTQSIALLEAISHGLVTVVAKPAAIGLPSFIEHIVSSRDERAYMRVLSELLKQKSNNHLQRDKIARLASSQYGQDKICSKFFTTILA